jgi:diguanylate cyclase (GGDEF)-like protein
MFLGGIANNYKDKDKEKSETRGFDLYTEQIRLLYHNSLPSAGAGFILTILIRLVLDAVLPGEILNIWTGYMLVLMLYRVVLCHFYTNLNNIVCTRTWANLIIVSALLTGIGWAGFIIFVDIVDDPDYKLIMIIVAFGVMAALVPVFTALLSAFFAAILPTAIALIYISVYCQNGGMLLPLTASLVYVALLVYTTFNTNRMLSLSLKLQRDNQVLIDDLQTEIANKEQAQHQLVIHKRDLEMVIEERTGQLTYANTKLEDEIKIRHESESQLRESHDRFTAVLDTLDAAVYVADMTNHELLFMNKNAIARWGDGIGDRCWKRLQKDPPGPCAFCTNDSLLDSNGHSTGIHTWERHLEDSGEWLDCRDQAIPWPDGRIVRMQIATDITERVMAEQRILAEHNFLQTIIDGVADPIMVVDLDYNVKQMNKAAKETPLLMDVEKQYESYQINHSRDIPSAGDNLACPLSIVLQTREQVTVIHRHNASDGSERLYEVVGTPLFNEQHQITGMVQASRDITTHIETQQELQEKKTRLEHIANHDNLTGLPNRALLADRLNQTMAQVNRRGGQVAVAYLDLDGFKDINDNYGHDIGDLFLVALANRLKEILRKGDTIARLGGDEFVAVLVDLHNTDDSVPLLERLLSTTAQSVHLGELSLRVSASIGVTFYPQKEDVDADQLLRQADQAMYNAKVTGKNCYHFFETEKYRGLRGHHESVTRIKEGLVQDQFLIHYQPKVNMRSGKLIGVEALIRWLHPKRGLVQPGEFLPLIEDEDIAVSLDQWVLEHVLHQMEKWQSEGFHISVSVNIGARFLQKSNFVELIQQHLRNHPQIDPNRLELEVLESSALEDMAQVSEVIKTCRDMGVVFALDDFGTGYSSLTYLKLLPAGVMKIDQSFVRDMLDDPEDLAILEGVLGLATAFRRQVIAEGVETIEHGRMLLQLGCEMAQGFVIAQPMPASELVSWLKTWRPPTSWTEQETVQREDLPLLFAAVEHRAWVRQVELAALGHGVAKISLDARKCRFGKWLHESGRKQYGDHQVYKKIVNLHQQAHDVAAKLCQIKASTDETNLEHELSELKDLRERVVKKLNMLI